MLARGEKTERERGRVKCCREREWRILAHCVNPGWGPVPQSHSATVPSSVYLQRHRLAKNIKIVNINFLSFF